MLDNIALLVAGIIGLFFGARLVIFALENISSRKRLSHLLVGLTVLAIGTSLPEIFVSIAGGIDKLLGINPTIDEIVIGNKLGSYIGNITLILGILGMTQKVFVSRWTLKREGIMLVLSLGAFTACAIDGTISIIESILMIAGYLGYLYYIISSEKKLETKSAKPLLLQAEGVDVHRMAPVDRVVKTSSLKVDIAIFAGGLLLLLASSEATVISGIGLATDLHVHANVIGILIVGIGTSVPELIADLTAIRRGSAGIAVGDILGSNICDILLATSAGAVIAEFSVAPIMLLFDIPIAFLATCVIFALFWGGKYLKRWQSALLVGFYITFAMAKIFLFN